MPVCDVSRANLKWACRSDPNAHHGLMPCAPDKVPPLQDGQVSPKHPSGLGSSAVLTLPCPTSGARLLCKVSLAVPQPTAEPGPAAWRRGLTSLSLCCGLLPSVCATPRPATQGTRPTLVLYASTLRWLQQFQAVLFRVTSVPIRRGTVHGNVRPKQLRFSRHLRWVGWGVLHSGGVCGVSTVLLHDPPCRDVDIMATCASGEVCYWGSASQQSGVHGTFKLAEAGFSYSLALVPFEDGLVRRPQADWHINTCQGAGEGIEVVLHNLEEGRRGTVSTRWSGVVQWW